MPKSAALRGLRYKSVPPPVSRSHQSCVPPLTRAGISNPFSAFRRAGSSMSRGLPWARNRNRGGAAKGGERSTPG